MSRYRNKNSLQNTLKDYFVPIIGGIIILLILIKVFSGDSEVNTDTPTINTENQNSALDIRFKNEDSEAFIVYPGNSKQQINDSTDLYGGETIIVKSGKVELSKDTDTLIALNKIAELEYKNPTSFALKSSDAWMTLSKTSSISMRYANITTENNSTLSLTQNEAGSTVYVLKGKAKVSNLAGVETSLIQGQKLSVSRLNASKDDFDIAGEKGEIDSFFKSSDWFLDNDGASLLKAMEEESKQKESSEEENEPGKEASESGNISLQGLQDEMSTDKDSINITGKILNTDIASLTIGNRTVGLNDNSFSHSVSLSSGINDVVIKMFDTDKKVLGKEVYTVYSSTTSKTASTNTTTEENTQKNDSSDATEYVISSRDFVFTAPSVTGKFTTTSPEITLRGKTTAKGISQVKVNGFKLASFNGSTWRYHAFKRFETLEEGTNQYKINYYNTEGNVVYTDYFTIVKKSTNAPTTNIKTTEEKVISGEASTS